MLIQLTIPQWLDLPIDVRSRLKVVFGIPRSSGTMVEDNRVVTDGHTHPDLAFITPEKMQAYTGSKETEFFSLFEATLDKVMQDLAPVQPAGVAAMEASPISVQSKEELFITHNGKMYSLTEVPVTPAMDASAPLYPTAPPKVAVQVIAQPKGKGAAKGSGKAGAKSAAKAK